MDREKYMSLALELAREAADNGEVPVGCVIADKDVHIRRGGTLIGHESYPLAVSKGSIV